MNTSAPLEVKVIFDASSRGRRRPMPRARASPRVSRAWPWIVLGLFNLLAAGGLYYATWWRVDPFLYLTLMLKTPVDLDLDQAAGIFVPRNNEPREPASSTPAPPSSVPTALPRWTGDAVRKVMGAAAYGWLTLATAAACTLSLSAGVAWSRIGGAPWRRAGVILAATLTLALAVAVFVVWNQYGKQYLPSHLRIGMGGLVLLSAFTGLAVGRAARGLSRIAAIALIISAIGTVIALYLGYRCGAIPPEQATPLYLFLAFLIHSGYGWIQLPVLSRMGR